MSDHSNRLHIRLFVEDFGHEKFITTLIKRVATEQDVMVSLIIATARGGHGRVMRELRQYLRDMSVSHEFDYLAVAIDANKRGYHETIKQIDEIAQTYHLTHRIIHAVPDPHIERWMLLDSTAFKAIFGKGCDAPDQRFDKNRYKNLLLTAVRQAGIDPPLGGMEYADDIAVKIDLNLRYRSSDFGKFLDELGTALAEYKGRA